jgi:hypothetical protein
VKEEKFQFSMNKDFSCWVEMCGLRQQIKTKSNQIKHHEKTIRYHTILGRPDRSYWPFPHQ